jgi:hypothetical protein
MTSDARFEMDLVTWLADKGPATAPPNLHQTAITRARHARQHPSWLVAVRGRAMAATGVATRPSLRAIYVLAIIVLLLATMLAVFAVGALRSDPVQPPLGQNGRITYRASEGGLGTATARHSINADGSGGQELSLAACPTVSLDGMFFAYTSGYHDVTDRIHRSSPLHVAAADGTADLIVRASHHSFGLSPNGSSVAWFGGLDPAVSVHGSALWVSPTDGRPSSMIVPPPSDHNESYSVPVWSPDGRQIAFAQLRSVTNGNNSGAYRTAIYVVNADGSNLRLLTSRAGTDEVAIAWSPDGRHIAYYGIRDDSPPPSLDAGSGPPVSFYPPSDLFLVRADGTDDRNVTNTSTPESLPAWSPDGSRLAYLSYEEPGVGWRLTVIELDRGAISSQPIVGPEADAFAWSPDAQRLVWVHNWNTASRVEYRASLHTANRDLGQSQTLLSEDRPLDCVQWVRPERQATTE